MNKFTLAATLSLAVVLILGSQAFAATLVPGGDFAMYKPGTGYTVSASFAPGNNYAKGVGDGLTVLGGGVADYGDGTSGGVVDVPGWVGPVGGTNQNDLWSAGYDEADGTTCLNVFGTWSGQNGGLIESADPLTLPALPAGGYYELSAMVSGPAGPRTLDLLVDGVVLAPDSSVDPDASDDWQKVSRTYDAIPAGDVTVLVGITKPGEGDPPLYGTRLRIDNVALDAIPEPSTLLLAAVGLLSLVWYGWRRR